MRVVLDTNVLVAGLLNPNGAPAVVLRLAINRRLDLLLDNRMLFEYEDVLRRPRFGFAERETAILLDFLRNESEYVSAEPRPELVADEDDAAFYEVARSAGADALVTGNKRHYPEEPLIVSPRELLKRLTA